MSLSLFHAGRIARACCFPQPGPLAPVSTSTVLELTLLEAV